MDTTTDIQFISYWNLVQQIGEDWSNASPKQRLELLDLEAAIFDEAGFDTFTPYQEAIRNFNELRENRTY